MNNSYIRDFIKSLTGHDWNKLFFALSMLLSLAACSETQEREDTFRKKDAARQELSDIRERISELESRLSSAVGEFERAQEKLRLAKQMQFGRTQAERENDIQEAATYRQELELQVQKIRNDLEKFNRAAQSLEEKIEELNQLVEE